MYLDITASMNNIQFAETQFYYILFQDSLKVFDISVIYLKEIVE